MPSPFLFKLKKKISTLLLSQLLNIYLRGEGERAWRKGNTDTHTYKEKERARNFHQLVNPQRPIAINSELRMGPGARGQELGVQSVGLLWVAGIQILESMRLLSSIYIRKARVRTCSWESNPRSPVWEMDISASS